MRRNPDHGKSGISHGICPECAQKYFGIEVKDTVTSGYETENKEGILRQ